MAAHSRSYGAAVGMSEYDDQFASKMIRRVFYAAQLKIIDNVSGNADRKKFSDSCGKNALRNHAGVGTGYNHCVRELSVLTGVFADVRRNISRIGSCV